MFKLKPGFTPLSKIRTFQNTSVEQASDNAADAGPRIAGGSRGALSD